MESDWFGSNRLKFYSGGGGGGGSYSLVKTFLVSTTLKICRWHVYVETRSRGRKFLGRVDYFESADLPHGVLPTKKAVIERSRSDAADMLASALQEHWIFCNLYTISTKNIKKHIIKLYEDFLKLLQTSGDSTKKKMPKS